MKSIFFASLGKISRLLSNRRKLKFFLIYYLRYPLLCLRITPSFEHFDFIRELKSDLILDVGFNKGQFAALCAIIFKNTPILGFDPLKYSIYPYIHFITTYLGSRFDFLNYALSNRNTFAIMKRYISSDSSSLFAPSDFNVALYPSVSPRGNNFYIFETKFSDIEMYYGQKTRKVIHELLLNKGYLLYKTANIYFNEYKDRIYCDCFYTRTNSL